MPRLTNTLSKPRRRALRQSSAPLAETQQLVQRARTHSQLSEAHALDVAQEQVRVVRRRK
jgi:hypothetical protein